MPTSVALFPITDIILDKSKDRPLYLQLYEALRHQILAKRLVPGQKLPPSRVIAQELKIARTTVVLAFDHLMTEGYIEGKPGSGTFVSQQIPEHFFNSVPTSNPPQYLRDGLHQISKRGQMITGNKLFQRHQGNKLVPFCSGIAAIREFPFEIWAKLSSKVIRQLPAHCFSYGYIQGYPPLRQTIADYLRTSRAVRCEPEQVIIVSGSQQALALSAQVLLDAGDQVWVEDPGYQGAKEAFIGAGLQLCPVPVDEEGLDVSYGRMHFPQAKLVYTTPSHQFPLGMTLSLARRFELLQWASRNGSWVLEDDYDSEYRYSGRPLSALQGIDDHQCVIYIGTFSKVLFPGLRLGYLVVPPKLVDTFCSARILSDRQPPILEQAILTAFMESGHFGRHIRKMRNLYEHRRNVLLEAIQTELANQLKIQGSDTGLNIVGFLPNHLNDHHFSRNALRRGIIVSPLSSFAEKTPYPPGILMGFSAYTEVEIQEGIKGLAQCFKT